MMKDNASINLASNVIALMHDLLTWQEHIERALRDTNYMYTFDDVVASILRQEKQLYLFDDCCVIMQLDTTPHCKVYHCFIACGTTEAILEAEPKITEVARELGCQYLSIAGRTGWPRKLKQHGWEHKLSVLHKRID